MKTFVLTGTHATGQEFTHEFEDISLLNAMRNMYLTLWSIPWFTHGIVSVTIKEL